MDLRLPNAPDEYDAEDQAQTRRLIEQFARQPFATMTEYGSTARIEGGTIPLEIYSAGRYLTAQFSKGTLALYPQDAAHEGGELDLVGAAAFRSWTIDTWDGLYRVFTGVTPVMEMDPTTTSYYGRDFRLLTSGQVTSLRLMRAAADNYQIRYNDDGAGGQEDAGKVSWAVTVGEGVANNFSLYQRPAGGAFVQQFSVDMSAVADDVRMLVWDVTAAVIKRVSRGAIGSGGVGFRLLRIVN